VVVALRAPYCQAKPNPKQIKEICRIEPVGINLLNKAMDKLKLSARAYDRILKVSRQLLI
jgi:magnesium chelatase family protein